MGLSMEDAVILVCQELCVSVRQRHGKHAGQIVNENDLVLMYHNIPLVCFGAFVENRAVMSSCVQAF